MFAKKLKTLGAIPEIITAFDKRSGENHPLCRLEQEIVELGKGADLCIVGEDDMSKGRDAIIGGRIVVEDGRLAHTHRDI